MNRKLIFIILGVVVILVLGYSFIWIKSGFIDYRPQTDKVVKPTETFSQSTNEVLGWKTYRDDKNRFEFKYPPLWKEESGHNNPTNDPVVVNFQDIEFQGDVATVHASVSVQIKERSLDFANLWRQARDASPQNAVMVADQKALKIGDGGKIVYSILFGSTEYGIAMESANGEDVAYYQSVFKKIISTFKFTR